MDTPTKTVVMYSSPTCAYCHMAAAFFEKENIPFTEKDISVDREALAFVLDKVGQAVTPIITVDDDIIVGFDRPKVQEALNKKPSNDKA